MKYIDDNYYHVYNRGAHRQNIFLEEANYLHLTSLFSKYILHYKVCMAAYCLMPNHYHLVLKQKPSGSISQFLKIIFNAYTQAINKKYSHSGTLFQGQAMIKHVDPDNYCLQLIRYVHRNPLSAKLVTRIEDWNYSNYLDRIGKREGVLIDRNLRDGYFKTPHDYEVFVESYNDPLIETNLAPYLFKE